MVVVMVTPYDSQPSDGAQMACDRRRSGPDPETVERHLAITIAHARNSSSKHAGQLKVDASRIRDSAGRGPALPLRATAGAAGPYLVL
jgi:hypothetical protein